MIRQTIVFVKSDRNVFVDGEQIIVADMLLYSELVFLVLDAIGSFDSDDDEDNNGDVNSGCIPNYM